MRARIIFSRPRGGHQTASPGVRLAKARAGDLDMPGWGDSDELLSHFLFSLLVPAAVRGPGPGNERMLPTGPHFYRASLWGTWSC